MGVICTATRRVCAAGLFLQLCLAVTPLAASAQGSSTGRKKGVDSQDSLIVIHRRTPSELLASANLADQRAIADLPWGTFDYPQDSLHQLSVDRARHWLDSVSAIVPPAQSRLRLPGMQLEPLALLALKSADDSLAVQYLERRLATPGLSSSDRAEALAAGVEAFNDVSRPEVLPIAEHLLAKLAAMGPNVGMWQLKPQMHMAETYYRLGRRDDALAHILAAVKLVPTLRYEDRDIYHYGLLMAIQDLLSSTQEQRTHLAAIKAELLAATTPSPERLAIEPSLAYLADERAAWLQGAFALGAMIGQQAPPLVANTWINSPPQPLRWDDGMVRLVDVFDIGGGLFERGLQEHIQRHFGDRVQIIGIPGRLSGHWGFKLIEPHDEVQRWAEVYRDEYHITFPIAFWVQDKVLTVDGGRLPPENPTIAAFKLNGAGLGQMPVKMIAIDRHGIIRKIFLVEGIDEVQAYLDHLVNEGGTSHD